MNSHNPFAIGLKRNQANFAPLTPLTLIDWLASTYPEHAAVIHGARRYTWRQTRDRCLRLASALVGLGVRPGDTVAAMLPNIPAMYEMHFGVAMAGAVLNTLNTRLDADAIAFMLGHGEAKVLVTDREFSRTVEAALAKLSARPIVIGVDDPEYRGEGQRLGAIEYESLLGQSAPGFTPTMPADEWDAIALNYTSGTTGNPKGVVYHHRGAYLNAVCNALVWNMPRHPVYLWTLPMFHCNGWCFPWTLAAVAGTNVCLRRVEALAVFEQIRAHRVTHYCGAPIVHNLLINAPAEPKRGIEHEVCCLVASAAPPAAVIEGMETMGFKLTHVYGLTETYGPAAVCAKHIE